MNPGKIAVLFGTRPEAIKLAPLVRALEREQITTIKIATGQHMSMLWQALEFFGMSVDYDLGVMRDGQSLAMLLSRILESLDQLLARDRPDLLIVQGDTATALGGGIVGYMRRIPVAHVEAGLRSFDEDSPFPEEGNRVMLSRLAQWHFAPTERARQNLLIEGVDPAHVWLTGNTIVDALVWARERISTNGNGHHGNGNGNGHHGNGNGNGHSKPSGIHVRDLVPAQALTRFAFVSSHRRENFGEGLINICSAIRELQSSRPDLHFIWPVHLNPSVKETVEKALSGCEHVHRIEPVDYLSMFFLLEHCTFILTDSGGIQEEAPFFHKPVLVMREVTERPELVDVGGGLLVGTDPDRIRQAVGCLLDDGDFYARMASAPNPFGDGRASERILEALGLRRALSSIPAWRPMTIPIVRQHSIKPRTPQLALELEP